ncbi:MAG: hypothetical protein ACI97N_001240 [Cognaticolwellia sp.]|jgi:hypothetical protein|tara:strand:+ start:878 stop:1354 length:477 start_codon:yes stop_codon:yes gene_type:complete
MKKVLFFALAISLLAACSPKTVEHLEGKNFGETISEKGAISYDKLLTKMESNGGLEDIKVEGKVEKVCQKKGCWITIVSDDATAETMVVKFKDYGFFMPIDLSGKKVVMHGNAYIETTSVDELRHYAEDAGESEAEIAKITEPKKEYKFLADGVVILD